ncbi:uncharacterized protein LOC106647703 [Copidosoma floridanum]|uniref:uncharacterized protein LOC106647703 n=1 Tax=Copidosoma floridanum TaxID=29053 RepID=UPI0006C9858A|nr:uncharacterized protein LOC106647703 [Copidosoma floridanum]
MMQRDMDLHVAVCFGDASRVQNILQRDNSSVNKRNQQGNAPLHMVYHGTTINVQDSDRLLIMGALLRHGANVNARGRWGETPLHVAARKLQGEAVELLLGNNADPNISDDDGRAPLHSALVAKSCHESIVRLLLQHRADANAVDVSENTPLLYAVKTDRLDLVRVLVDAGARVNFQPGGRRGCTALFHACRNQNADMVGYLVSHGADARARERRMRMTPLHELASSWREHRDQEDTWRSTESSARILLEHNVDVNERDCEHMTALHLAAHNEDEGLIRVLLEAGAAVDPKDSYGDTPLHQLLDKKFDKEGDDISRLERITRLFVEEYGADITARNGKGQTPFQLAVSLSLDSMNIVNFMLAKLAGVQEASLQSKLTLRRWCRDSHERIAPDYEISVAVVLGYSHVVDRFIEIGYDLEASGETLRRGNVIRAPLYYAVKSRQYRIAKMLLEAGCRVDSDRSVDYGSTALHVAVFDARDVELCCLLLEFGADLYREDAFGKNALTYALEYATTNSSWSQLTHLLVYYYVIDARLHQVHPSLISAYGKLSESSEQLSEVISACESKLDQLRGDEIIEGVSKFDVLGKRLDALVKFLGDGANCDAIANMSVKKDLESYEYIIKVRTGLALERRKLLDAAKECLNAALGSLLRTINYESLPEKIVWNILGRLTVRELDKFVKGNTLEQAVRV